MCDEAAGTAVEVLVEVIEGLPRDLSDDKPAVAFGAVRPVGLSASVGVSRRRRRRR